MKRIKTYIFALIHKKKGTMKTSESGLETIMQNEGFSAVPYVDNKGYSIGYGHYMGSTPNIQKVTSDEAKGLMLNDLLPVEGTINNNFNNNLTQKHFDALADFGYNSGSGHLQNAINYLLNNNVAGATNYMVNVDNMNEQRHQRDADKLSDFSINTEPIKANIGYIILAVVSVGFIIHIIFNK